MLLLTLACTENELVIDEETPQSGTEKGTPDVLVEPLEVIFDDLVVGDTDSAVVRVDNVGDRELKLEGLELDSDAFSVTALPAPLLAAGEGFDLVVDYQPWTYGDFSGTMLLDTDDPDTPTVEVLLSGGTLEPSLVIDPDYHDFGTLIVGDSDTLAGR